MAEWIRSNWKHLTIGLELYYHILYMLIGNWKQKYSWTQCQIQSRCQTQSQHHHHHHCQTQSHYHHHKNYAYFVYMVIAQVVPLWKNSLPRPNGMKLLMISLTWYVQYLHNNLYLKQLESLGLGIDWNIVYCKIQNCFCVLKKHDGCSMNAIRIEENMKVI